MTDMCIDCKNVPKYGGYDRCKECGINYAGVCPNCKTEPNAGGHWNTCFKCQK